MPGGRLPITWLPSCRLWNGGASSFEFDRLAGREGFTALKTPQNIDRSVTLATEGSGIGELVGDFPDRDG